MTQQQSERSILVRIGPMIGATVISLSILIFVSIIILNGVSDRLIRLQAERESIAWAGYLGSSIERIEEIAKGSPLTPDEHKFLSRISKVGDIFRFKIFAADGRLGLVSDSLHSGTTDNLNLGEHNENAALVVSNGKPFAEIKDGSENPDRPDVFVEAYVPILRGGKIVAISEVYVDETNAASQIKSDFAVFGFIIAGLTLLVLLVPLWALRLLTRELQQKNKDLNLERARAVEAENAKSAFLAHMSHELRTPLNAIQGLSEMMIRGDLGKLDHPKYLEYSRDINFSAAHLLKLVNDILDLSKIEAGKFDLEETEFDLSDVINESLRIARAWPKAEHLTMVSEVTAGSVKIHADARTFKQILLNLLSNATKFTPPGGKVQIAATVNSNGDGVIKIIDTGYGIPEKDLSSILEPFNQLRRPAGLQQEGTGLGLSLVKSMIEMHGGTISIESRVGDGTTVTISLPAERILPAATE